MTESTDLSCEGLSEVFVEGAVELVVFQLVPGGHSTLYTLHSTGQRIVRLIYDKDTF